MCPKRSQFIDTIFWFFWYIFCSYWVRRGVCHITQFSNAEVHFTNECIKHDEFWLYLIENLCRGPHIFRDLHLFQFQYNSPRKILLLICWVCMFLATKGKISGKNGHCSKGGNFFFKSLNFSFWDSRSHMRHYCLLYCFIHFWASWFPPTYFTERVKMINEFVYQAISKQL